ncbi:MAG TPA: hypothetical protein VFG87_13380, partial [Amycolatopsis sp.]|nr:hypothetical protein [Amycolatopsis sp.]
MIVRIGGAAGVDEVFSDEEIKRLRSWPDEFGRNELIRSSGSSGAGPASPADARPEARGFSSL